MKPNIGSALTALFFVVGCGGSGSSVSAPSIVTQPQSLSVNVGSPAILSVSANGTGLNYRWSKDGSTITGATQMTYSIASVTPSDAGSYLVVVSNSEGSVTSATATLTVTQSGVTNVNVN